MSIDEPSGEGKGERSRSAMWVLVKEGRWVRARAIERPKTPDPRMRIDEGGWSMMGVYFVQNWKYAFCRGGRRSFDKRRAEEVG